MLHLLDFFYGEDLIKIWLVLAKMEVFIVGIQETSKEILNILLVIKILK